MLNGLDLFSGIGGLALALKPWVDTVAYCEIDRFCQGVLLSRMADGTLSRGPIWDDVSSLSGAMLPAIDIVYGGFPCQDISIAGLGKGLAGERSILVFEALRLVAELRPSFVFLENVTAIRFRGSSTIVGRLAELGYDCRWDVLGAHDLGAPHQRDRWWFLAHTNRAGLPEPGSEPLQASPGEEPFRPPVKRGVQDEIWLPATGELCRVPDGLRPATHRIKSLGNAVVPQCAREAFCRLMGVS